MRGSRMIGLVLVVLTLLPLAGTPPAQAQHPGEEARAPVVGPPDTPLDESRFALDPSDPDVAGVAAGTDRYHWAVGGSFQLRHSALTSLPHYNNCVSAHTPINTPLMRPPSPPTSSCPRAR